MEYQISEYVFVKKTNELVKIIDSELVLDTEIYYTFCGKSFSKNQITKCVDKKLILEDRLSNFFSDQKKIDSFTKKIMDNAVEKAIDYILKNRNKS